MATYKYKDHLIQSSLAVFDIRYAPGAKAVNGGVYRCMVCNDEIGVARGTRLPAQEHHKHEKDAKIVWQLLVVAEPNR